MTGMGCPGDGANYPSFHRPSQAKIPTSPIRYRIDIERRDPEVLQLALLPCLSALSQCAGLNKELQL